MNAKAMELEMDALYDHVSLSKFQSYQQKILELHHQIHQKNGIATGHSAWLDLPKNISNTDVKYMQELAEEIRNHAKILVVIGIGGSYLASKSVIEALKPSYTFPFSDKKTEVIYAGHHLDADYHEKLLEHLDKYDFYIHLISKSGKTLESLLAFKIVKQKLEQKIGKSKSKDRIIVTTESLDNPVGQMANQEGYRILLMSEQLVGRYSILSPVGLLAMAVSGISIQQLIDGANSIYHQVSRSDLFDNSAYLYGLARHLLYQQSKKCEFFIYYHAALDYFSRWWQQLFSESLGKNGQGLLCCTSMFTSDLHSLGQWIQEGDKIFFETILQIAQSNSSLSIPYDDSLKLYSSLNNQPLQQINHEAIEGIKEAHIKGKIPIISIKIPTLNAYYLGQMIYFFQKACVMNGYLMQVNPFTQSGVEQYKSSIQKRFKQL